MKLTRNLKIAMAALLVLGTAGGSAYVLASSKTGPSKPPKSGQSPTPYGWKECVNATTGYRISYPGTWYTASLGADGLCTLFDPKPIVITPGSEYPPVGMEAVRTGEKFGRVVANRVDAEYFKTISRTSVTVAGRNALRIETVANGEDGLFGKGTTIYGYVVDWDGTAFIIQTSIKAGGDVAAAKKVIDTAATTLRFTK